MTGIYIIKNLVNGKVYIGQSKNVRKRLNEHKSTLRRGAHSNMHLQNAFRKSGEYAFWFGPLCECTEDELDARERGWIDWYRATDRKHGYNLESGGCVLKTHSEETRRKISKANKGRIVSDATRQKMSEANKGKTLSEEHRRKLSVAGTGKTLSNATRRKISEIAKNMSDATRQKMSKSRKGHPCSEATRRKISDANKKNMSDERRREISERQKGRTLSKETRRKISEVQKGQVRGPLSDETRRKISEARKLYYARKKSELLETNA